jgi:DNA-binding NarL/FixJ family response regulator
MVGKLRPGRFTWKKDREVIAMARNGATAPQIAAKFNTSVETIERKARALGIRIKGHRGELGLKAKK